MGRRARRPLRRVRVPLPVLADGKIPAGGEHGLLEPFTALSFLAAHSSRLRLGTGKVSEYHDDLYDLPACRHYPKPVQKPHPPIHFGGESDPALRRVADLGQGWYGFGLEPERVTGRLATLERLLAERGRSRDEIVVSVCPYLRPVDLDAVKRYREAGVDQVILMAFAPTPDEVTARLDELARTIAEPASRL